MKKYFLITILLLTGCVTTQQIKTTDILAPDEGILVAGLNTNWEGHDNPLLATLYLLYQGKDAPIFGYNKLAFQGANHIVTAKLPANGYHFYDIDFGTRGAKIKEGSNFTIYPGKITYVGSIDIQLDLGFISASAITNVTDESDKIKKYLQITYPELTKNREFITSIVPMVIEEND